MSSKDKSESQLDEATRFRKRYRAAVIHMVDIAMTVPLDQLIKYDMHRWASKVIDEWPLWDDDMRTQLHHVESVIVQEVVDLLLGKVRLLVASK